MTVTRFCHILSLVLLLIAARESNAQIDTVLLQMHTVRVEKTPPQAPYHQLHLDRLLLRSTPGNHLGDALARSTPLFIKTYGQGSLATPGIRGTGASHTKLFWNGIPINNPNRGQADLSLFPLGFSDAATVNFGASSLINGSGGLGGSIALDNEVNYREGVNAFLSAETGSFGYNSGTLNVGYGGYRWQGKTVLSKTVATNDFEFTNIALPEAPVQAQQNAAFDQQSVLQEFYYMLKDNLEVVGRIWHLDNFREIPANMTSTAQQEQQTDVVTRSMLSLNYTGRNFSSSLGTAYLDEYLRYENHNTGLDAITETQTFHAVWNSQYNRKGFIIKSNARFSNTTSTSGGYDGLAEEQRGSAFLEWDQFIGRKLWVQARFRQEIIDGDFKPFLPGLGVRYTLATNLFLKGNAARNFHAPTLNDRFWTPGGNPDLLPEEGWMFELGAVKEFKGKSPVTLEINYFNSIIDNWIQWAPTAEGYWSPQNLKEVNNRGLEAQFKIEHQLKYFKVLANGGYAYTASTNTESSVIGDHSEGKQLIYVPFHNAQASIRLERKRIQVFYDFTYTSDRFITSDNLTFLPSYWLSNAGVQAKIDLNQKHQFVLSLEALNLWDTPYQTIAWRAMPGRNYRLRLQYQLNR